MVVTRHIPMVIHFFIQHHHQAGQHHHRPQEIETKLHIKHFFKFSHNVVIVSFEFLDDRFFLRNLVRLLIRSSVYCGAADAQDMRPDNWRPFSLRPIIVIIITRPKPAYGRHGLAGSWGQDTDEVSTFLVFLTSHFASVALSSDLTNLGPLTMATDQKP